MKWLLVPVLILWLVGAVVVAVYLAMTHDGTAKPKKGVPIVYAVEEFKDDVSTNAKVTDDQLNLEFIDRSGTAVRLSDFRGKKHVALVFLRGLTKFPGGFCASCNSQTSRLLANHDEFVKRDTEVLIVFPGDKKHVDEFVKKTHEQAKKETLPFVVLLDENFKAVESLGIRADAAKPSTYIVDKEGQVRFAYVGATTTDRPSLAALFKQLDALAAAKKSP